MKNLCRFPPSPSNKLKGSKSRSKYTGRFRGKKSVKQGQKPTLELDEVANKVFWLDKKPTLELEEVAN